MSSIPPVGLAQFPRPGRSGDGRLRVLLVEDDPDDALLLERHLKRSGFIPEVCRVETASDMLKALDQQWDCVLADYNLPLFSAPEALRVLKAQGRDIPFIMMSGAVSEETAVSAMRAGAHDYVSKENLTRLVPAIEREMVEAAARQQNRATAEALRSSEARFHRLVEATPLALLISDMRGRVTYFNRGVAKLFGTAAVDGQNSELTLSLIFPWFRSEARPESGERSARIAEALRIELTARNGETWETTCQRADSSSVTVLIGAAVLNPEAEQEDHQLAVFFVDLTEQKRSEELLRRTEKLAAAGRLAASIAHEINNPLEAITNCIFLIGSGDLDERSRGFLEMAQRELDRVSHITTQTLRFYRQSTRPVAINIGELFEQVLALYQGRIRDHGIEVVRQYNDAPQVTALDGEIRQVLANIVGNAIDALVNGPEPRTLLLRSHACRAWHAAGPGLSVIIADSGTGISRSVLSRIFEPFFSTKGITGTGLGLWVTREIVQKHHGRLQVRTRQTAPSGTVFRIVLPLNYESSSEPYESGLPTLH